ncbi:hypothetical protein F8280_18825 [Micromonospora noduli]|uniref:hypothetical protein n=1 Tax=Micromonospora noduli TaxID=709876 RepID=UPI00124B30D3|nr:hypothetical protein [Micromonospora noduli]KAB1922511.1 hypothetical protein F8280_18825 [Micromonospora noduli]
MDAEDEQLLAACNQLANLTREVINDTVTGTSGDMWTMVYGQLEVVAESPDDLIRVFQEQYNVLNKAAGTMILVLAQMYAERVGVTDTEAVDQAQAMVQAAFEG